MSTERDNSGLHEVAEITAHAEDLEGLVRPLLAVLAQTTGLDSTVLTLHDRAADTQVWRFVHNEGRVPVPEGFAFPWAETLCQRMIIEDRNVITDLADELPDHPAHTLLGVRGFVSLPYTLVGRGGEIAGTLCAGSLDPVQLDDEQMALFQLMAGLIADRLGREIEFGRERLRAERAERQLRDRSAFVAAAEHSLKSPLTVISGWSEMLASKYAAMDDAQRLEAVERIRNGAARLWSHVDDLLDEARTTVLADTMRPGPLALGPYLRDVAAEYDGAASEHTVVVNAASGTAHVDRHVLDNVLGHLLENAIKYAPAGTTVHLTSAPHDGGVVIQVRDEGPGVDENIDVFAPFERGSNHEESGSGLGLHIVQTLVSASGGTISVTNETDGGARFDVLLPASSASNVA